MDNGITIGKIKDLQDNIARLEADALHGACAAWRQRERSCLLVVLIHIAEIARRKLHLDRGFMHLGDYCQQCLGMSEGEAWTRVYVAKASNAHPELLVALGSGQISLAVAALIARHLTVKNCNDLLQRCAGKSKRQVEALLAAWGKETPRQRSSLRPVLIQLPQHDGAHMAHTCPVEHTLQHSALPHTGTASETALSLDDAPSTPAPRESHTQVAHQLRCTIDDATKNKLLRLAEVLGIVDPLNKLDQLITKATEIALQAKDPALRSPARKAAKKQPATSPTTQELHPAPSVSTSQSTRTIPAPIKRQVFARAQYRCEYVSAEGRRCAQKTCLEIDHRFPYSWGGTHQLNNLQLFCRAHHLQKTIRQHGPWTGRSAADHGVLTPAAP